MSPRSYSRKRRGSYGSRRKRFNRADRRAAAAFAARSERSQSQDLRKRAKIAPTIEAYIKAPNRWDWVGVDLPGAGVKANAKALSRLAREKPVEIMLRRKPSREEPKTRLKRFQVRRKTEPAREEPSVLQPEIAAATSADQPKRTLPTKEAILQRATEKYLELQAVQGLPSITPEEDELKESGIFEEARRELMRGVDTIVDPMVERYIADLRAELEPQGFTIVPFQAETEEEQWQL